MEVGNNMSVLKLKHLLTSVNDTKLINDLKSQGVVTLEDLLALTDKDVKLLGGVGKKSFEKLDEIRKLFTE